VKRLTYEVCVLLALRKRLRSKEFWVEGGDRYRNPDHDLPGDLEQERTLYYSALKLPPTANTFLEAVKEGSVLPERCADRSWWPLDIEDVRWTREGMVLNIRVSKTDQEGRGIEVGIPNGRKPGTCPVRLLKAWIEFAEVKSGPIFRPIVKGGNIGTSRLGDRSVALIVKLASPDAGRRESQLRHRRRLIGLPHKRR
jgi:hypothetical protein